MPPKPCAYDIRFLEPFLRELARRGHPNFPTWQWFGALESADAQAPCSQPRLVAKGQALWNDESSRFAGVAEPRIDAGKKRWCYAINRACDAFWAARYG
jgi:hypothetical protein